LGNALGIDLINNPDLALEPATAYLIMSYGMRAGTFIAGHSLAAFITPTSTDYYNARSIVNGLDKADVIADAAEKFEAGLRASLVNTNWL